MSVATISLISLAELATYPGIPPVPSASETAILEPLIDAMTLVIEKECQQAFVRRSFTEDYTYEHVLRNPHSKPRIELRQYPIVSVTSITDPDANTIPSTDYWIDKAHGWLVTTGSWQIPQDANGFETYWTIVYIAGRWVATANVDANLKLACKMLVAQLYSNPDQNIASKSVGDLSLSYTNWVSAEQTGGFPPIVKSLIAPYRRRDV